mmetsp:Transcript_86973/g.243799  ORF Transcript_86973/g.243799 Transcript_86973/m.243799 type:complete len:203 (-) Transcript_86973:1195-1803(-)
MPAIEPQQPWRWLHLRQVQVAGHCHLAQAPHDAAHGWTARGACSAALPHQCRAVLGHARRDLRQLPGNLQAGQILLRDLLERNPLGKELEKDHGERIHVRFLSESSSAFVEHLRRSPNWADALQRGLDHGMLSPDLGEAEIAKLRCPSGRAQDVRALQVQVQDPLAMQILNPTRDAQAERERLRQGQWLGQRGATVAMQQPR